MGVDTGLFLEDFHVSDVIRAYGLAYLEKKGVKIKRERKKNGSSYFAEAHKKWNFAPNVKDDNLLIRTEDNCLFTHQIISLQEGQEEEEDVSQPVATNLQERFLDVIARLMTAGYKELPTTKLRFSFPINHYENHWTLLMATFEGLNKKEYKKLYRDYQEWAANPNNAQPLDEDGNLKPEHTRRRYVRNFLLEKQEIILNSRNQGEFEPGNCLLPLASKKIKLHHYDSLNNDTYFDKVVALTERFTAVHNTQVEQMECDAQKGNTCGDWTAFNAFNSGVLTSTQIPTRTSVKLRQLKEQTSIANASALLYEENPVLKKVPLSYQVKNAENDKNGGVPAYRESYQSLADENDNDEEPKKKRKSSLRFPASAKWNNRYTKVTLISRVAIGLLTWGLMYTLISSALMTGALVAGLVSTFIGIVSAHFGFNAVMLSIFGELSMNVRMSKKGKIVKDAIDRTDGLSEYLGFRSPYHKSLEELEDEIGDLLRAPNDPNHSEDMPDNPYNELPEESRETLTHYFAKQIIENNPACFYNDDQLAVRESDFVNEEESQKIVDSVLEIEKDADSTKGKKVKAAA